MKKVISTFSIMLFTILTGVCLAACGGGEKPTPPAEVDIYENLYGEYMIYQESYNGNEVALPPYYILKLNFTQDMKLKMEHSNQSNPTSIQKTDITLTETQDYVFDTDWTNGQSGTKSTAQIKDNTITIKAIKDNQELASLKFLKIQKKYALKTVGTLIGTTTEFVDTNGEQTIHFCSNNYLYVTNNFGGENVNVMRTTYTLTDNIYTFYADENQMIIISFEPYKGLNAKENQYFFETPSSNGTIIYVFDLVA